MTKSFTLKFFSSHREQKSQTFIIIILNKISILLYLHCQPKEKHSLLVFCPRIRTTLEDLRGNMTDVGLESGVQKKSSQPQWNNAEQSQRRGSLQVAAYSLQLRNACYVKSKIIGDTGLASQTTTNPSASADIELPRGFSLARLCNALQDIFHLQHGTKMTSLVNAIRPEVLKPNFALIYTLDNTLKEQRGFQKVVEYTYRPFSSL